MKIKYYVSEEIDAIKDLKLFDKLILDKIIYLSNNGHICFASNAYFSNLFGIDISSVKRSIKKLKTMEILNSEEKNYSLHTRRKMEIKWNILSQKFIESGVHSEPWKSESGVHSEPHKKDNSNTINSITKFKKENILYKYNMLKNPSDFQTDFLFWKWINISGMVKHNYFDCTLQTYKYTYKYLKQLKMGTFFKKWKIDQEFIKKYEINLNKYDNYKFTFEEILECIDNYKNLRSGNYVINLNGRFAPFNQIYASNLPKALNIFMYNHINKKSWLLICHSKIIKHKNDIEIVPDEYSKDYYILEKAINIRFKPLDMYKKMNLLKVTKSLIAEISRIKNNQQGSFRGDVFGYNGTPDLFLRNYVNWLQFFYADKIPISVNMIGIKSGNWPFYLSELEQNGIKIK